MIIIILYLYHLYYLHTPRHIIGFVLYCMLTGRWAYCWNKPIPIPTCTCWEESFVSLNARAGTNPRPPTLLQTVLTTRPTSGSLPRHYWLNWLTWLINKGMWRIFIRLCALLYLLPVSLVHYLLNPLKLEFTIVIFIFIHYKLWIAVAILDL